MVAGGVLALVHAVFAVTLRADQIVSGTALNFLALGITGYLYVDLYGDQGTPDDLPARPRRAPADQARSRSSATSFGQLNLLVWVALLLVLVTLGRRVPHAAAACGCARSGENPLAAETAGPLGRRARATSRS